LKSPFCIRFDELRTAGYPSDGEVVWNVDFCTVEDGPALLVDEGALEPVAVAAELVVAGPVVAAGEFAGLDDFFGFNKPPTSPPTNAAMTMTTITATIQRVFFLITMFF
jgi:hypothetical protein